MVERWQYPAQVESLAPTEEAGGATEIPHPQAVVPVTSSPRAPDLGYFAFGEVPIVPAFGWFSQDVDLFHTPPPHQLIQEVGQLIPPPEVEWGVATTTVILGGRTFQIQAEAEPAFVPRLVVDWNVAQPDVIRLQKPLEPGISVLGQELLVGPPSDWNVDQPDVTRLIPPVEPGFSVLGQAPIAPSYDWSVAQPDIMRIPDPLEPGLIVSGQPPIIPSYDWFRQLADVMRLPVPLEPGAFAFGYPPILTGFDWFRQQTDVMRLPVPLESGLYVRAIEESELPEAPVVIDWLRQLEDVIRRTVITEPGISVLGQPPIIPITNWIVVQPDVIRLVEILRPGLSVLGRPPAAPAFDWHVAQPDVIRLSIPLEPGMLTRSILTITAATDWLVPQPDVFTLAQFVNPGFLIDVRIPVAPAFDWYRAASEPTRLTPHALWVITQIPIPGEIFLGSWWQQYPEMILRPPLRPYFYPPQEFRTELDIPVLLQWLQQYENPILLPRWLLSRIELPLLDIAAPPFDGIVFVLQACLILAELERNRLMPNFSGFVRPDSPIDPDPSGWIPSGRNLLWDEFLSGILPPPSGFTE